MGKKNGQGVKKVKKVIKSLIVEVYVDDLIDN